MRTVGCQTLLNEEKQFVSYSLEIEKQERIKLERKMANMEERLSLLENKWMQM